MEVLNCHSSDQMLDGIVLAVQTPNLHCFKSEILFGNYGWEWERQAYTHGKQLYWYLRSLRTLILTLTTSIQFDCSALWSYQEPLSFFCVLCSAQLSSILSKLRFHEIVILILQMLHLHLQLYLNFSTESHCICRLNERTR